MSKSAIVSQTTANVADRFRVVVVDDEPLARKFLRSSLEPFAELEVIAECENGRQALEVIREQSPDLVFLDIQMPGLNGFDVIRSIQAEKMPEVIFVTAYDEYAIDAFDANAVDYLLKPITDDRLNRAVKRALIHLGQRDGGVSQRKVLYSEVNKIAERVKTKSNAEQAPAVAQDERRFTIKDGDSVILINESDIDWIDAAGDYMCIHVDGQTHIIRSTMHQLLNRLEQTRFKRVHRSTIVNVDRIIRIKKHTKGEYMLYLSCDETIKVSRHYKNVIKDFIDLQP